jgi:hypothetical protein
VNGLRPDHIVIDEKIRPEIGSENWVKAQIAAKIPPHEHDRPKP